MSAARGTLTSTPDTRAAQTTAAEPPPRMVSRGGTLRDAPASVLALQRRAGNRAVARALSGGSTRELARCVGPCRCGGACDLDLAAEEAASGHLARGSQLLREAVLARQTVAPACPQTPQLSEEARAASMAALCIGGDDLLTGPAVVPFTPREQRLVVATLWAARGRAAQAANNLSRGDQYMDTLASSFFHEDNLDQNELANTARSIHEALMNTPYERGTCANQLCTKEVDGHREGSAIMADADVDHVTHTSDAITICPFFFDPSHSLGELVRTWLHEAGHIARIDDPPPNQPYVHPPNCEAQRGGMPGCAPAYAPHDACPGGDKRNVDNWAYFIEQAASG